jgi:glucose/arabinose dehydrogenase
MIRTTSNTWTLPAAARASIGLAFLLLASAPSAHAQLSVPTGFVDELIVSDLDRPLGLAFLPDGRLLFIERTTANVHLIKNGGLSAGDPILTVPDVRWIEDERGLHGIVVDPRWPTKPYVYVQYTSDLAPEIHISRFTVTGDLSFTGNGELAIDPASRYDVITQLPDFSPNHNGGTLRFGPDGMLYSSLGEDGNMCAAQDLTQLLGKILRLDVRSLPAGPGGPPALSAITPADNPFVLNADPHARLVWIYGLRNPFRFHIEPATGEIAIGDVGWDTWEELDIAAQGGLDFGWPWYEGPLRLPITCANSAPFSGPLFAYQRPSSELSVSAISAGFYHAAGNASARFPLEYEGNLFFTDYYRGWVWRMKRSGGSWVFAPPVAGQGNPNYWATGNGTNSDFLVAPDGSLWYCQMHLGYFEQNTGQIRRIRYTQHVGVEPHPTTSGIALSAPYPSPTSGAVTIAYTLPRDATVTLEIFDPLGRRVRTLASAFTPAGRHESRFGGVDEHGAPVEPGVYTARLGVGGRFVERRFVVLK